MSEEPKETLWSVLSVSILSAWPGWPLSVCDGSTWCLSAPCHGAAWGLPRVQLHPVERRRVFCSSGARAWLELGLHTACALLGEPCRRYAYAWQMSRAHNACAWCGRSLRPAFWPHMSCLLLAYAWPKPRLCLALDLSVPRLETACALAGATASPRSRAPR